MSSDTSSDHPDIIAFPPFIFLGCALISIVLRFLFPLRLMDYSISWPIGTALALLAVSMAIWAVQVMRAGGTNVRPDKPALAIVRQGPYRFTRNPMYLALCILHASLGFLLNSWMPIIFTPILASFLHFGVVLREEHYLESKFGENYLALKRSVRRWI